MGTPKGHIYNDYGCKTCDQTDPSQFYSRRKTQCKSCFNRSQMDKWACNKQKAVDEAGGKCSHCGYDKYIGALEFHHTDPATKEPNWNNLWSLSADKIDKALEETILLCANCHREEHERIRTCSIAG